MSDDKAILVNALEEATIAYHKLHPNPTILGSLPDNTVLGPLAAEIGRCEAYRTVAGQMIFSGTSGPILHAESLASGLFDSVRYGTEGSVAADILLRVLQTTHADGQFKAALWGIRVDHEVALMPGCRLVPFDDLPKSYPRDRILERARSHYDGSPWVTHNYFDRPLTALIEAVPSFPYIGTDGAAFRELAKLESKAHELSVLIQAAAVGRPLAIACWFEFNDHDLQYLDWDNNLIWLLPEIAPRVTENSTVDPNLIRERFADYNAILPDRRSRLLRSMERFRLSQSRSDPVDRVLDLALAFEIAVSEDENDGAPSGWKVSVRTAQLIGGPLDNRQNLRSAIADLYRLRNRATHGSSFKPKKGSKPIEDVLRESYAAFVTLMNKLLAVRLKPDWKTIELGASPPDREHPEAASDRSER